MSASDAIVAASGALLTLMVFSLLYRENPMSRFAEHLFVGVSAAYWMVMAFWFTVVPNLLGRIHPPALGALLPAVEPSERDLSYAAPLLLGLLLFVRSRGSIGALGALPHAFVSGFAAGAALTRFLRSDLLEQVRASWIPLVVSAPDGAIEIVGSLRNLTVIVGTITGLSYVLLAPRRAGGVRGAARIGHGFMLVAFGAILGHAAISRIATLLERLEHLRAAADAALQAVARQ